MLEKSLFLTLAKHSMLSDRKKRRLAEMILKAYESQNPRRIKRAKAKVQTYVWGLNYE